MIIRTEQWSDGHSVSAIPVRLQENVPPEREDREVVQVTYALMRIMLQRMGFEQLDIESPIK